VPDVQADDALRTDAVAEPQAPNASGVVRGVVTTQNGTIPLGGVSVTLKNEDGVLARVMSEGDGSFHIESLPTGKYMLAVDAPGFDTLSTNVTVVSGREVEFKLDLKISSVAERVDVVASTPVVPNSGTITVTEELTSRQLDELSTGGGLQSALRLLASVIQVPGGLSIKGGRPSQATVQLGPGAFVDPVTGLSSVSLPDDAIDSVTVLPNPYAVEYGRFSSGLVLIRTRRAADQWKTRLNDLDPNFMTKRGEPWHPIGILGFSPRFETGGPLVRDRVFLQTAAQYRYRATDVPSRPQDELRTSHLFSSFSRLDANLAPRHSLVFSAGFFPGQENDATLGTFTPPNATVNLHGNVTTLAGTERALWSDNIFSETTVEAHTYATDVLPQGNALMELFPETTLGNFFNRQHRETNTYQIVETVSGSRQGAGGLHLYKAGIDLLYNQYEGSSASQRMIIRRSDGTVSRILDFSPLPTSQSVDSTDMALYVQDRIQPTGRWYVEAGARLDRDGVLGRFNVTPRIGSAVLLNQSGSAVIRSGYGLFFERTPSAAGAYDQFESPTDTRYAADGITPLGPSTVFHRETAPDLRTARSHTWDLAFDQRFNARWAVHVSGIDRRGSHELLVQPSTTAGLPVLRLSSDGRSRYREAEFGFHYTGGHGVDLNVSYVYAQARADLNAFTVFFDNVLWPIVGENAYAPARTDVPHRLLVKGRANPRKDWLVLGVLDWRAGLPYSLETDARDFIGPRNAFRLPNYFRLDLGLERRFTIGKLRPWIGVRANNALDSFSPADVQAVTTSPAFGTFYNSEYRQFRIQVRFER
jgi:hypothetical protein